MCPMDLTTLVRAARMSGKTSLAGVDVILNPVALTSGVISCLFARPIKPGGGVPSEVPNTPSEEESWLGRIEEVSGGIEEGDRAAMPRIHSMTVVWRRER